MKKSIFFVLLPILAAAQFQFLPVTGDFASFHSTDSTAYVEIYLSIYQGNLQYVQTDSGAHAVFSTSVDIYRDDDLINNFSHKYENTTRDTSKLARYSQLIDIFKAELPYGNYTANLKVTDQTSSLSGEYLLDMNTIQPSDGIYFSDIEFSNSITKATGPGMYVKNNLNVIPNPSNTFDLLHPMLYYYVEIHNLPFNNQNQNYYDISYWISNEEGDTVKSTAARTKKIAGASMAEIGGMNIMALPKANYFLNLKVTDIQNNQSNIARKRFYVYKPESKTMAGNNTKMPEVASYYNEMNVEELKEEFEKAKYIATRQEQDIFKNLENQHAMGKFLTSFWKARDEQSGLGYGVYRTKYLQRAEYCNAHFTYMGKKGWKSDRGRVYLVYGEPNEYERFPNEMGALPYVIWYYYELEGGAQFIFADLNGFGEYQLIHSTYRKELQDPNWMDKIRKGNQSMMSSPDF